MSDEGKDEVKKEKEQEALCNFLIRMNGEIRRRVNNIRMLIEATCPDEKQKMEHFDYLNNILFLIPDRISIKNAWDVGLAIFKISEDLKSYEKEIFTASCYVAVPDLSKYSSTFASYSKLINPKHEYAC